MTDPLSPIALELGWVTADVFHLATVHPKTNFAGAIAAQDPTKDRSGVNCLVGSGEFDPAVTLTVGVQAIVSRLVPALCAELPGLQTSSGGLEDALKGGTPSAILVAIEELHLQLLTGLEAQHQRAAVAYGLGRALADTAFASTAADIPGPATERLPRLVSQLDEGRVDTLTRWLATVADDLTPGVAEAIAGTLQVWAAWAHRPGVAGDPTARFNRQASRWRDLLTGSADLQVLASAEDTELASGLVIRASRRQIGRLAWTFKVPLGVLVILISGLVWASAHWSATSGQAILSVGAVLTALGVTWKGVGTALTTYGTAAGGMFAAATKRHEQMLAALVRPPGVAGIKELAPLLEA